MTIIQEMREFADGTFFRDAQLATTIRDWADRLAASGAIVPVPQGEAVPVYELGGDEILVQHDGKIYYGESDGSSFAALAETKPVFPNFEDDTIVLPVALVPITEAEV